MNKHLYRIIFNKARGLLMVVAENVSSGSKSAGGSATGTTSGGGCVVRLTPLRFALMAALGLIMLDASSAQAAVVADPGAPAAQQPGIGVTGNGVAQVNITAPSAGGVSRNTYQQFDVDRRGVILNNSATSTQTQLGGWVDANPALGRGTARVILNEVNSSNPSQLNGYVEVAGARAQVVIANPSGISCDGCGFINANRSTLTTGRAQFENGVLQGYQVDGGKITVNGAGMDTRDSDYTEVIARTVEVNAGIWAKDLNIQAGKTSADNGAAGTPVVGIDVAQLGGMYAGKIVLVGNGAGVGVRNAGQIGASVGDVVIRADGRLENSGQISSAGSTTVETGTGVQNSGTLYAKGDLTLNTSSDLDNSGIVSAQGNTRVTVANLRSSSGSTLAGGVRNAGQIGAGVGDVVIRADGRLENSGQISSAGSTTVEAGTGVQNSGTLYAKGDLTINTSADLDNSGMVAAQGNTRVTVANLRSTSGSTLAGGVDSSGKLGQTGGLTLDASGQLSAHGQNIAAESLQAQAGALDLSDSQTSAAQVTLTSRQGDVDVSRARVAAKGTLTATAAKVLRTDGAKVSAAQVGIKAGQLSNVKGEVLQSGLSLTSIDLQGALDNSQGVIASQGALKVTAASLNNYQGSLGSVKSSLTLTATNGLVDNSSGHLEALQSIALVSGQLLNTAGFVGAGQALDIRAGTIGNGGAGQLQSGTSTTIVGASLDNHGGRIEALGDLTFTIDGKLDNSSGLIRTGADLLMTAAQIDNAGTQGLDQGIGGRTLTLTADQLGNQGGSIIADQALTLTGSGVVNNQSGKISAGTQFLLTDRNLAAKTQTVSNQGGTLVAGRSLTLNSASYSGSGQALSLGDLSFTLNGDYVNTGLLQANGNLTLATTGLLSNQASLQAGNLLTLSARQIDNAAVGVISAPQVQLSASQSLVNRGLIDGQSTRLSAPTLSNLGTGRIYGDQLSLAAGTLTNTVENGTAAVIAARVRLDIGAQYLNNSEHGLIFSVGDMAIGGALDSAYQATGQARELNNASATIEALGGLTLNAASVRNTNEHFSTREVEVSRQALQQYQLTGSVNRYDPNQISTYNNEVDILVTPEGSNDDWNRYNLTRVVTQTQIASSDPGQILAGGNLRINADQILNDKSRIIAGGALQASANSLTNTEVAGQQVTTDSGALEHFYRIQRKGRDRQGIDSAAYNPAPSVQAISLQPTVYKQNTAPQGSGTQLASLSLGKVGASEVSSRTITAPSLTPISEVLANATNNVGGVAERILTGGVNIALPDNALFRSMPSSTSGYLIETDPRFTNYAKWLSSDYMLGRLNLNPAATQQRMGDGFYEQKLIREQVAQLTGRRFVDGYANDEAQYRGLIDNAVTYANSWKLIPGVALSAEQMAQLTSDIVWLVAKNVTLASGEVRSVLVPQVYVRVRDGDINGAGGLMAGQQLNLNVTGNLVNSASLSGRRVVAIKADTLNNLEGRIQGSAVSLDATQDLNNLGGQIAADKSLMVSAGRDLNVRSSTITTHSAQGGQTNLSRVAGLFVSDPAASLMATAGRDINLQGAQVANSGSAGVTSLSAGRDLNLTTVIESRDQSNHWDKDNWRTETSRSESGSSLKTQGDLGLRAGNDLNARAASLSSTAGAVIAQAARDVNLTAGENARSADEAHKVKGSNGFLSSKTTTTRDSTSETTAQGSHLDAQQLAVQAGRNLVVQGSQVVAEKGAAQLQAGNDISIIAAVDSTQTRHDKDSNSRSLGGFKASKVTDKVNESRTTAVGSLVSGNSVDVHAGQDGLVRGSSLVSTADLSVSAGRDLQIDAAQNTFSRDELHKEKNHDFTGVLTGNKLGLDDMTGNQHLSTSSQNHTGDASETTLTGSTLGSSAGNVSLNAGRTLGVTASDLVSTQSMSLTGANVTIAAGMASASQNSTDESRSLAVGRVVGGTVIDSINTMRSAIKAANSADDPRLKAVKWAQAALAGYNLGGASSDAYDGRSGYADKKGGSGSNGSLIKIGTELASTHNTSTSEYDSQTAKQSSLTAGKTLTIIADGSAPGTAGDIHVIGSSLKAADTLLQAKNNLTLESAQSTANWANDSNNDRTAIGVSFNIGEQNGFTLDLGASIAKSMGTGDSVTQVNSTLDTGSLVLRSGQDTTLAGAQVRAQSIKADIGGNLTITSRQDSETQKSEQGSAGFGGSICIPPFCYGAPVTASASLAAGNMNSNYKAVTDQSGLFAGAGGYNIHVGDKTTLQGAVIASEASADKNLLDTNRLIVSDIKNVSEITSQSAGLSVSYSSKSGSTLGGSIPLSLSDSDHSSTRSAVSEGTIVVRSAEGANDLVGLNRDTANANQKLDKPDQKAMQERIDLIQSTVQLATGIVGAVAKAKADTANKLAEEAKTDAKVAPAANAAAAEAVSWNIGGDKRLMADIATGLIAAGLGGVGGATAVGIVANTTAADTYKAIGDYADQREFEATDSVVKKAWGEGGAARILLHTLAGATQGLSSGNALAGAQGAAASATFMPMVDKALKDSSVKESERNSLATLISAGVGAAAASGGNLGGQVTAAITGNAVDAYNRQLHPKEIPLLKNEAPALALAAGISVEEAETRLGRALAYYTDAGWHSLLSSKGLPPDQTTLTYLGRALAPLGSTYDPGPTTGDVPVLTSANKTYTPDETLSLVQNYQLTHSAAYADNKINLSYLRPIAELDPGQTEAIDFYNERLNLKEGANIRQVLSAGLYSASGDVVGQGQALAGIAEGIFSLGKSLVTHPVDTSDQIANGLVVMASRPGELVSGLWNEGQETYGLAKLYELQDDPYASAALKAKYKAEWAASMFPVSRVSNLAKIGNLAKLGDELVVAGRGIDDVKGAADAFTGQVAGNVGDFSSGLGARSVGETAEVAAKDTAKFFELATADDLALTRAKYNLPDGNTIGVARTDIPGFESEVIEGLSPVLRRNSGLPSLDDLYGEARVIKSPYNNPLFTRHAEEDLFNNVANKIDRQGLTSVQLDGRVVDVKISNASGICNKCSAGLTGNSDLNGVVKQFSERYPTLLLRVTAEGGAAMPNRLTVLVKGGRIVNGQ
uniref:two-partner secretion domain-containing protein n=1 Tax=Pseudomonas helvetica TaxID=3136738 RepID=UPI003F58DDCA